MPFGIDISLIIWFAQNTGAVRLPALGSLEARNMCGSLRVRSLDARNLLDDYNN